ncbi:MAG: sterol desaturase family protein [Oligoflexia bacterium]|nr:sterol desaturase family protein [Oligoflexia bacterium]
MNDRLLAFGLTFFVISVLEILLPYKEVASHRLKRWSSHFLMIALFSVFQRIILPIGLAGFASNLSVEKSFYGTFENSSFVSIILTLIILDFFIYWQHRFSHTINWFWKLHRVHHSDERLDVSSALRFHPLEMLISFVFKLFLIFVFRFDPLGIILFEVLLSCCALFNHGKFRLPQIFDRFLQFLIVTPKMHRVHHSIIGREMNMNFGFSISLWDLVFGTYLFKEEEDFPMGVEGIHSDENILDLLKQPWK